MHKLIRPSAPMCLNQYRHGRNNWRDITRDHKNDIWLKLDEMQQYRCAYCEQAIKTTPEECNSHIEHLRQCNRYSQGTFSWDNLFGSCNREDSCGKYKDRQPPYNHADLIKLDTDDPEIFLTFLPDGNVVPKKDLSKADKHRAEETIRIFNLNGTLRQIRNTTLKGYFQTAEDLLEYVEILDETEWLPELEKELEHIKLLPFSTAIKHILQP